MDRQPAPRSDRSILAGVWGAADSGSLQSSTAALGGALGFDWGRYRVEATLGWWWPKSHSVTLPANAVAAGRFSMWAGAARGCISIWQNAWAAFGPCAGGELQSWQGQGNTGTVHAQSSQLWGVGLDVGARGRLALTNVISLRANADVLWLLNPPAFGFNYQGARLEVFRPDELVLRVSAGAEVHFW